jgi:hypothetical protein
MTRKTKAIIKTMAIFWVVQAVTILIADINWWLWIPLVIFANAFLLAFILAIYESERLF